jgi:hypothetical protein
MKRRTVIFWRSVLWQVASSSSVGNHAGGRADAETDVVVSAATAVTLTSVVVRVGSSLSE